MLLQLTIRRIAALAMAATHGALVAMSNRLPDAISAVVAWTVYFPLWLASGLGLPVFGRTQSGGWATPNGLGWASLAIFWIAIWLIVMEISSRVGERVAHRPEKSRLG